MLRRDPGDSRAHLALGRRQFRDGRFEEACESLHRAVHRLTSRHPNPETGEAHYYLGLTLRTLGRNEEAYAAFYKATWNFAWRAPAYYELALFDCLGREWRTAAEHAAEALETNRRHHQASVLLALLERRSGRPEQAAPRLDAVLERDPFDPLALWASSASQ